MASQWGNWAQPYNASTSFTSSVDMFKDATVDVAIANAIGTLSKLDKELVRLGEHRGLDVNVNINLGVIQITLSKNYPTK